MSRTRLQGLEIAGVQIGIEVPSSHRWTWPDEARARFACLPRSPDVHVGVRVGTVDVGPVAGERYALGPWTFEVGRRGADWLLGLSRAGRREQLAIFDAEFGAGEVVVREPLLDAPAAYPLRGALDEWIVLHRLIARGGLCLHATLDRSGDGAVVRLVGPDAGGWTQGAASTRTLLGRDTVWISERGGRMRAHRTPWGGPWTVGSMHEVPVGSFELCERSLSAYHEVVDPEEASELLVAHAVVPLGDEALFERVLKSARRVGSSGICRRVGKSTALASSRSSSGAAWRSGVAPPRGLL